MYECTFADLTRTVLCSCSWCPRLLPGAVLLLGVSWCSTAVPRLGSMMQRVHWALLAAARLGAWVYRVSCKTPIDLTEVLPFRCVEEETVGSPFPLLFSSSVHRWQLEDRTGTPVSCGVMCCQILMWFSYGIMFSFQFDWQKEREA